MASLILLPHSYFLPDAQWEIVWFQIQNMYKIVIRPSVYVWRQTTIIVNRADRSVTDGVVSCYKQSATLGICCSQSSSVELTTPIRT